MTDVNLHDISHLRGKISHKKWRALIKKQKRKCKRQVLAQAQAQEKVTSSDEESTDDATKLREQRQRELGNQLWLEREKIAQIEWRMKKEREKSEKDRQEKEQQRIKEEWEEQQRKEKEELEKRDKGIEERKKTQDDLLKEATKNQNEEGEAAWHNPIAPTVLPGIERDHCPFFQRVGACRFGERCSRAHVGVDSSCTLLFPAMYTHFELDQGLRDDMNMDIGLEYDEGETYQAYVDFYEDVYPEFQNCGTIVMFKVCCNYEPHLRGNVYVQYESEDEAATAYLQFNGRWYGGKQLQCEYSHISDWKRAICGLYFKRKCPKGKNCNFMHVFKNPGNTFWSFNTDEYKSNWRSNKRHRSRSRDRTARSHRRHRSRSYSPNRRRSRSPSYRTRRARSPARRRVSRLGSENKRARSRSRSREHIYSKSRRSRSRSRQRKRSNSRSHSRSREREQPELRSRRSRSRSRQRKRSPSRSRSIQRLYSRSRRSRSRSRQRERTNSRSRSGSRQRERSCSRSSDVNRHSVSPSRIDCSSRSHIRRTPRQSKSLDNCLDSKTIKLHQRKTLARSRSTSRSPVIIGSKSRSPSRSRSHSNSVSSRDRTQQSKSRSRSESASRSPRSPSLDKSKRLLRSKSRSRSVSIDGSRFRATYRDNSRERRELKKISRLSKSRSQSPKANRKKKKHKKTHKKSSHKRDKQENSVDKSTSVYIEDTQRANDASETASLSSDITGFKIDDNQYIQVEPQSSKTIKPCLVPRYLPGGLTVNGEHEHANKCVQAKPTTDNIDKSVSPKNDVQSALDIIEEYCKETISKPL